LKIENWFGNKEFLAPFSFKWNDVFVQNNVVLFTVIKKKDLKTVAFWWHCLPSSFLGHAVGRGRRFFSPPLQRPPFAPQKKYPKPNTTHTPLMTYHHDEKQRGQTLWAAMRQLLSGHSATSPFRRDWIG
jgi:hypothetical protein